MNQYYLRVEGVNLASVLEDTQQLSVIRGSGLLLKQAISDISDKFSKLMPKLEEVSTGASIGLFCFDADKSEDTENEVIKFLNEHPHYRYLTFVVSTQVATANFRHDKEAAIARNRFAQMSQLSVSIPKENTENAHEPCAVDNLRPAKDKEKIGDDDVLVSQSISKRLNYGRDKKTAFYARETGLNLNYTKDLKDLSELTKLQSEKPELKQLDNKIAVLYFDGNGFSKIQNTRCHTVRRQIVFDKKVQQKRRDFLTDLLNELRPDSDFFNFDALRFETLLWGGDEMIFVVPAWKGLKTLHLFYKHSKDWKFAGKPLTHAGGIVFCHANTPIQRVEKLAKDLAESVKNSPGGREGNFFDYAVLESIDFPTESIEHFRARQFPGFYSTEQPREPLAPFDLKAALALREQIPKSQAYALARSALDEAAFTTQHERFAKVMGLAPEKLEETISKPLAALFPNMSQPRQWLHLVELWDYLGKAEESA